MNMKDVRRQRRARNSEAESKRGECKNKTGEKLGITSNCVCSR